MSLTSYRAAPPRVKLLPCPREKAGDGGLRADAVRVACFSRPEGFLGRQPRAKPVGCGRYVPTPTVFGKGCEDVFFDFVTGNGRGFRPNATDLPEVPQRASLRQQNSGENA